MASFLMKENITLFVSTRFEVIYSTPEMLVVRNMLFYCDEHFSYWLIYIVRNMLFYTFGLGNYLG